MLMLKVVFFKWCFPPSFVLKKEKKEKEGKKEGKERRGEK